MLHGQLQIQQGQKCHSRMIIPGKIKGLDLICQTDAGWKTERQQTDNNPIKNTVLKVFIKTQFSARNV